MLKKLFILLAFTSLNIIAQNKQLPVSKYVNIEAKDSLVYAVSKTQKLVVWNIYTGNISYIKKNVSCIQQIKNKKILIATPEGEVLEETAKNKWKKVFAFTGKPYFVHKNSLNKYLAISSKGIKYNNKYYLPTEKNRFGNGIYSYKNKTLRKPDLIYVDKKDRIWLSYNFGKFAEVFIFDSKKSAYVNYRKLNVVDDQRDFNSETEYLADLRKKQFKKYPTYVQKDKSGYIFKFPIELPLEYGLKSICEDKKGTMYFSEGLPYSHNKNGIYTYSKTSKPNFYSVRHNLEKGFKKQSEIIGPLVINPHNQELYYYSNYGVHKLIKKGNDYTSELIADPNILLYEGMIPHQYGSIMDVKKLIFTSENKFTFLTTQYGFGHFDGENVVMYN